MGKNVANVDAARAVVDLRDQPESIALDIEHGVLPYPIGRGKNLAHVHEPLLGREALRLVELDHIRELALLLAELGVLLVEVFPVNPNL